MKVAAAKKGVDIQDLLDAILTKVFRHEDNDEAGFDPYENLDSYIYYHEHFAEFHAPLSDEEIAAADELWARQRKIEAMYQAYRKLS